MKLEIEITEEEIKSAIERRVRVALSEQNSNWNAENHIKDRVKQHWDATVESLIAELVGDSAKLQELVDKAVEVRIKARVQAALKTISS